MIKRKTVLKTLLGIAIAGTVLAIVVSSQLSQQAWRCEICMSYKGRTSCKAARGPSKEEAYRSAADTACALIASGVTERMACPRQAPSSETCESLTNTKAPNTPEKKDGDKRSL